MVQFGAFGAMFGGVEGGVRSGYRGYRELSTRTGFSDNVKLRSGELVVYSEADIMALGEKASFRFTPQIGQLLKSRGIATEARFRKCSNCNLRWRRNQDRSR